MASCFQNNNKLAKSSPYPFDDEEVSVPQHQDFADLSSGNTHNNHNVSLDIHALGQTFRGKGS